MKATSRAPRIIRRVIKTVFVLFVLLANVVLLWRVFFSANIPKEIKTLTLTPKSVSVYRDQGDGITLRYQEQATVSKGEKSYGYFGIPQVVFIPDAEQVQIVFRYNNSTLKNLAKDYGLEEIPDKALTHFDVTLVKTTDLTPEDASDNTRPEMLSRTRYHANEAYIERDTTTLYTYYRYVFDGVTVETDTVGVFADVYYLGDLDYEQEAYGRLCLYDYALPWLDYPLSAADKKALEGK